MEIKNMEKKESNYCIDNYPELRHFFSFQEYQPEKDREDSIRITQDLARYLLLNNANTVIKGAVVWFKIQNLGLGVYEVELNKDGRETVLTK